MPKDLVKQITLEEVEYLCFQLVDEVFPDSEPIPIFETRFEGILESSITQPFQQIAGKDLYPSFVQKSSILFYLCIKNHPFENGNKRVAVLILLIFLINNNKWLECTNTELYELAVYIAKSKTQEMQKILAYIKIFLLSHIKDEN